MLKHRLLAVDDLNVTATPDVDVLLSTPGTHILAMDSTGGQIVPLPESLDLGLATAMVCSGPLDLIGPGYHGAAVAAFEAATRRGHGSTLVTLNDQPETYRLHILDLEEPHGCFVAIAVLDDAELSGGQAGNLVAPRQGSFRTNVSGVFISIGTDLPLMLGWDAEELLGRSALDFIHPDDHENAIVGWIQLLESPTKPTCVRQRLMTKSGEWLWCDSTDTNHLGDDVDPHVTTELIDVSRELAAQAALQRRETLLDRLTQALPSGVLQLDADGAAEIWNDRWPELTGADPEAGVSALVGELAEAEKVKEAINSAIAHGIDADLEVSFANVTGICQFGILHIRPLRQDDHHSGLLLTLDDVTSLRTYQHELAEQTQRDPLTGVFNRFGLEKAIEGHLEEMRLTGESELALLFLDLDQFKATNDAHGHATGDSVLRHVANEVTQLVRPGDVVGRLGGDEFLVMMVCEDAREQAVAISERIATSVAAIADKMPEELVVGVTIGAAIASPTDDFDSLIRRADEDMYEQKRSSRLRESIRT